jgi:hypothetical protein
MLTVPVAAAVLDALALAEPELEVEAEGELDELLHPAASPVQAMASRATTGTLFLEKPGIIFRTLPPMVA